MGVGFLGYKEWIMGCCFFIGFKLVYKELKSYLLKSLHKKEEVAKVVEVVELVEVVEVVEVVENVRTIKHRKVIIVYVWYGFPVVVECRSRCVNRKDYMCSHSSNVEEIV